MKDLITTLHSYEYDDDNNDEEEEINFVTEDDSKVENLMKAS